MSCRGVKFARCLLLALIMLVAGGQTAQATGQTAGQTAEQTVCSLRSEAEIIRGTTLAFLGQVSEIEAGGWLVFSDVRSLYGVELKTPRVWLSAHALSQLSIKRGGRLLVAAVGDFEHGYAAEACVIEQLNKSAEAIDRYLTLFFLKRQESSLAQSGVGLDYSRLIPLRKAAQQELADGSAELARRFFSRAASISKGQDIDKIGEGQAYLRLGQSKLALSSFDDVLEKDSKNSAAWAGRYQALMQMARFSELPPKLPDMPHLALFGVTLPATVDLSGRNLSQSWWRGVTAKGAQLSGANLQGSFILESNFNGADLRGANLAGATLRDSSFKNVLWDDKTVWPDGFTPPATQGLGQGQGRAE